MRNKLPTILLVLSTTTLFAFDVGQEIELKQFLNGRASANFLKSTKNVETTLAKGTTGSVQEVKNFSSGNTGIKMKVTSGPKAGESYWVYYNKKNPTLKLVDVVKKIEVTPEKIEVKEDKPTSEIEGHTTADTQATRAPEEQIVVDTVKEAIELKDKITEIMTSPTQKECPPVVDIKEEPKVERKVAETIIEIPKVEIKVPETKIETSKVEVKIPETKIQTSEELKVKVVPDNKIVETPPVKKEEQIVLTKSEKGKVGKLVKNAKTEVIAPKAKTVVSKDEVTPVTDDLHTTLYSTMVSPEEELNHHESQSIAPFRQVARSTYDTEHYVNRGTSTPYQAKQKDNKIVSFSVTNNGKNAIVPTEKYNVSRRFDFEFDDQARSEIKMVVSESPDSENSTSANTSIMLFFPRIVLPSIKVNGNEMEVTLPTKEVIKYDATTREIIGGVISEGKMEQLPNGTAKPASLKYNGEGVIFRADRAGGNLPYGDIEGKGGTGAPNMTPVTISKKGKKDCVVKSFEIWRNNSTYKTPVINKELQTDEGVDAFLKKKCGFSLF